MTNGQIQTLRNGGDWACAHAAEGGLAQVFRALARLVGPDLTDQMTRLADLAETDMLAASGEWERISGLLRALEERETARTTPRDFAPRA
jgi:hypothetical protein